MSNVLFIADTHFGHRAIINFERTFRPFATIEQHDADLVRRWNAKVTKRDVVWHLGDLAWTRDALLEYVPQLNGRLKLVLGNHDNLKLQDYLDVGIESIHGCVGWRRRILLTHMPTHLGPYERWVRNLHGHTHSRGSPEGWTTHTCVSAELIDLTPISLDELTDR